MNNYEQEIDKLKEKLEAEDVDEMLEDDGDDWSQVLQKLDEIIKSWGMSSIFEALLHRLREEKGQKQVKDLLRTLMSLTEK